MFDWGKSGKKRVLAVVMCGMCMLWSMPSFAFADGAASPLMDKTPDPKPGND